MEDALLGRASGDEADGVDGDGLQLQVHCCEAALLLRESEMRVSLFCALFWFCLLSAQAPWDVGGGGVLGLINLSACGRNPPVTKLKGHTGSIQDLAFSPFYESILATASEGRWRERPASALLLELPSGASACEPFSPCGCFVSSDTTIRIWDAPDDGGEREVKDAVSVLSGSSKKLNAIEWNPVADFILASGCFDGVVSVW